MLQAKKTKRKKVGFRFFHLTQLEQDDWCISIGEIRGSWCETASI